MGVVPGGGSIMVHLLKFETEIRKKLTDANAATQVRAPLHKSVYVCVFVLCMCVCVRVLLLLLLFSVEEKLKRKIFFLQRAVNVNETQKNVGLFVGFNYLTSFFCMCVHFYHGTNAIPQTSGEADEDYVAGLDVVFKSLTAPMMQIAANAGIDGEVRKGVLRFLMRLYIVVSAVFFFSS